MTLLPLLQTLRGKWNCCMQNTRGAFKRTFGTSKIHHRCQDKFGITQLPWTSKVLKTFIIHCLQHIPKQVLKNIEIIIYFLKKNHCCCPHLKSTKQTRRDRGRWGPGGRVEHVDLSFFRKWILAYVLINLRSFFMK